MKRKHSTIIKLIALILIIATVTPVFAKAAVADTATPYASAYLTSYSSYIGAVGGGNINIYFSVTGTNYWDTIGCLRIILEESTDGVNWDAVKTYHYTGYSAMMGYDKIRYNNHVSYDGTAGRYYRAYVSVWAGDEDGNGDTRYIWTSSVKAT